MDFADAWQEAGNLITHGMTDVEVEELNELIHGAVMGFRARNGGMFIWEDNDEETTRLANDVIESFGFHCFVAGRIFQTDEAESRMVVEMTPSELLGYTRYLAAQLQEAE